MILLWPAGHPVSFRMVMGGTPNPKTPNPDFGVVSGFSHFAFTGISRVHPALRHKPQTLNTRVRAGHILGICGLRNKGPF